MSKPSLLRRRSDVSVTPSNRFGLTAFSSYRVIDESEVKLKKAIKDEYNQYDANRKLVERRKKEAEKKQASEERQHVILEKVRDRQFLNYLDPLKSFSNDVVGPRKEESSPPR